MASVGQETPSCCWLMEWWPEKVKLNSKQGVSTQHPLALHNSWAAWLLGAFTRCAVCMTADGDLGVLLRTLFQDSFLSLSCKKEYIIAPHTSTYFPNSIYNFYDSSWDWKKKDQGNINIWIVFSPVAFLLISIFIHIRERKCIMHNNF